MQHVFAFWVDGPSAPAEQAELVSLWARGWKKRGWTPRLLTARDAKKLKSQVISTTAISALRASGGLWLCPITAMNFSLAPTDKIFRSFSSWHPMAEVVDFAGWSVEKIIACGREI